MQGERGRWIYAGAPVGAPSFRSGLTSTNTLSMNILKYSPIGHQKDRNIDRILIYLLSYHLSFKTEYDYIKLPYIELCLITYLVSSGLEAVFKKIDPGYFFHIPGPPWYSRLTPRRYKSYELI